MTKIKWPPQSKADIIAGTIRGELRKRGLHVSDYYDSAVIVSAAEIATRCLLFEFETTGYVGIRLYTRHYYGRNTSFTDKATPYWLMPDRPDVPGHKYGLKHALVSYRGKDLSEIVTELMRRFDQCSAAWFAGDLGTGALCDSCPHQLTCVTGS